MSRIVSLVALISALGCSSEGSESTSLIDSNRESRSSPEPQGGAPNLSNKEPAPGVAGLGSTSNVPAAALPGKLPPTRETALATIDRIAALYQDYADAADPPGTHKIVGVILDDDLFPHSNAKFGENWRIQVTPTWLTLPAMTVDVLALTSCHEMGHFVGGFPFKGKMKEEEAAAATEGQADYFATKDCLPRLWANERDSNAAAFAELDSYERELCTKTYGDLPSQELCARMVVTAIQAAGIYHESYLKDHRSDATEYPRLDTPDPHVVELTAADHSNGQCRLDTMVAGIQCKVKATGTTIPGFLPPYGKFSDASKEAARPFACQDGPGARPRCWYAADAHEHDCGAFEGPRCIIANGVAGVRMCNNVRGEYTDECANTDVCLLDEEGSPSCVPTVQ